MKAVSVIVEERIHIRNDIGLLTIRKLKIDKMKVEKGKHDDFSLSSMIFRLRS